MTMLAAYDPKKVICTLGLQTVTGFAPDTKLVISRSNNVSTKTEGVDGDLSINIDSRFSGTLSVSLLHNASFNKVLAAWVFQLGVTGYPFFPVEVEDPSGMSISTVGCVEVQTDYTTAQETGTLEWVIGLQDARLKPSQASARVTSGATIVKSILGL